MNKQNNTVHIPVTEAFAGSDMFVVRDPLCFFTQTQSCSEGLMFYPSAVDQSFNLFNRPKSKLMVHVITV